MVNNSVKGKACEFSIDIFLGIYYPGLIKQIMMFNFHKPKVYRSPTGCCICKAKSSSSRFTDSKKYESEFAKCFLLKEPRTGEICNACVLLVKRFKKLPPGSLRNWFYTVDSRGGPGVKSSSKYKSKKKKKPKDIPEKIVKKKHVYVKSEDRERSPVINDDVNDEFLNGNGSKESSRSGSPEECDDIEMIESTPTEKHPIDSNEELAYSFIDLDYFRRTTICCGVIFRGQYDEIIVVPELIKRCSPCIMRQQQRRKIEKNIAANSPFHSSASTSPAYSASSSSPAHSPDSTTDAAGTKSTGKVFSDNSWDSGYDESSNQGVGENKVVQNNLNNSTSVTDTTNNNSVQGVQLKSTPPTETVRLVQVPIKVIKPAEKFGNKSTLLSSKSLTSTNSHSHTIIGNPLDDFATHAVARQSVIN
ncbi:GSCOCG00009276001-RA-CDS [Cotesia congregata]|uniref:Similar to Sinhcaf: SIN3-HDAC complex-associated factor (Mus musculus) n=1 Tax=Cotesia congregata TaxID=51543 RepID=A0A8J2H8H5_COTCN|nr:GSCOCG00009276001-RA-CDS [Cotesia congregata]CAG5084583.1 Similar to Sinhcaf: SIN3-HDAC complex-associated factor (Mus musculus) [Cotesia congregata]